MAIIVEDGTGKIDADAYVSVADADTYHTAHSDDANWSGAATAAKERGIRLATQYLDARFDQRWKGTKKTDAQSLDWPRSGASTRDGYAIDNDALPTNLEYACAELALRVVAGDTLIADDATPGMVKRKKQRVGSLEVDVEYLGGQSSFKRYRIVDWLVANFVLSSGEVTRG